MDLQLKNETAFISGSTAGIGYAIASQLATEGAKVIINGRSAARLDAAVEKLKSETGNTDVSGIIADFSKSEDIEALLLQLPAVDILINNLSIFEPKPFIEITDEDWLRFYNTNIMSGVRLSRAYISGMLQRNKGRIIFISSESGVFIPEEMIHYGVTKTAQIAVARGLAEMTKGTNVTVNSVLPGPTLSEGVGQFVEQLAIDQNITIEQVKKDFFKNMRPTSLLQRFLLPEEVANMVTYLVSPRASATNGAAIRVDGGLIKSML
ncbi:MAG: SDR family NAD(P)-dependent oxidoreductase [Flavobacterium sp.]|nr:SDR family NAD(P)-dependent oxidoreductase [Flavobacterium sp.]